MRRRLFLACAVLLYLAASRLPAQTPATPATTDAQKLFARDHLMEVRLVMTPEDWRQVRLSHPEVEGNDAVYLVRPAELSIDGVRVGRVGLRKKGTFGSVVSTRPAFKVKLDEYVQDLSYSGVNDLTLNNNAQDPSLVHQLLAYDFFARAGVPAPRAHLAHVSVNGEDLGIYTHVEAVAKPFLRRVFGNDTGALYETVTGDFTAADLPQIAEKRGSANDRRKLEQLKDLLAVPGPVSLPAIEAIVDMDSFIRFWAAESLLGHWDGYSGNRNNTYLYIHPRTGKLHFIPWGADQVFIDPGGPLAPLNPPKSYKAAGLLTRRLWELPDMQARYQKVLRELLDGPWNEQSLIADMNAFQRLAPVSGPNRTFMEQTSERDRAFITRRRAEVMAELSLPAPRWPAPLVTTNPPYTLSGTFTAPWVRTAPQAPMTVGTATLAVNVDGKDVPFVLSAAYALTNEPPAARATYPGVVITGAQSVTSAWRIVITFDPFEFGTRALPIDQYTVRAQIQVIEDGKTRTRNLGHLGQIRLEEARTGDGGAIRGTISLKGLAP